MSSLSPGSKSRFVSFLKGFFGKSTNAEASAPEANNSHGQAQIAAPAAYSAQSSWPTPEAHNGNGHGQGNGNGYYDHNPAPVSGHGLELPLQSVVSGLPMELRARLRLGSVGDIAISVPLEKILTQLATGTVKITFGELRKLAPDAFAVNGDRDQSPVILPLSEILARLNPALLVRRSSQRQVKVPDDITGPFGADRRNLAILNQKPGSVQAAPAAAAPAPAPLPPAIAHTPPAPMPPAQPLPRASYQSVPIAPAPARNSITSVPPPAAPAAVAPSYAHRSVSPVQPSPAPMAPPRNTIVAAPPTPPAPTVSHEPPRPVIPGVRSLQMTPAAPIAPADPVPQVAPAATVTPIAFAPAAPISSLAPAPVNTAPAVPHPVPSSAPAHGQTLMGVPITALAETWPDVLRQELVQSNLVGAKVALPIDLVEAGLKRGKVSFQWKLIRSWIQPTPITLASSHDELDLELPLRILAPLFLARRSAIAKQNRVEIDAEIPNLFFGANKPEASASGIATGPVTKPVDTNYYTRADIAGQSPSDTEFKQKPSLGTTFVSRYAEPNEVVSRAASLEGVAGALIALPDGLMVASQIPAELNPDTVAAFLPQIFGKVSQSTKELRMGDLNNLSFTVGNVPWKIFRVHSVYFAAFGKTGQPMPSSQLAALAAELDRKKSN